MKEVLNWDKVFGVLLGKDCLPVIFLLTTALAISFLRLNLTFQNLYLQPFNICTCLFKKAFSTLNLTFFKIFSYTLYGVLTMSGYLTIKYCTCLLYLHKLILLAVTRVC